MTTNAQAIELAWQNKTVIRVPHKFDPLTQYREWWGFYHILKELNPNIIYGTDIIMAFDSDQEAVEFKLKYL